MRISVSTDKCIASGCCVLAYPQIFTQRESDGVVQMLNLHPPLEMRKKIQKVVDGCPAGVFAIEDEENTTELMLVEEPEEL